MIRPGRAVRACEARTRSFPPPLWGAGTRGASVADSAVCHHALDRFLIPGLGFCARSERCKPVDQLVKAGARKSGTAAIAAEHTGPLIASVRWPAKIKPDATPRAQFLHVNDVVPTLYDLLSITPPRLVDGVPQVQIDGRSFASTFNDPKAKEVKRALRAGRLFR